MGFKSLIEKQVQGAMKTLGQTDGLAPPHDYVSVNGSTYDPSTGDVTRNDVIYNDVPMVLARFKIEEMDESVVPVTDQKALIAALDLPVTPKEQDRIHLKTGEEYSVEKLMGVPGESIYILHIRRQEG